MKTMWKTKVMSFRKDKNYTRILCRVSGVESVFKLITSQKSNELEIMTILQTQYQMKRTTYLKWNSVKLLSSEVNSS